jgi:hypothetical protein
MSWNKSRMPCKPVARRTPSRKASAATLPDWVAMFRCTPHSAECVRLKPRDCGRAPGVLTQILGLVDLLL